MIVELVESFASLKCIGPGRWLRVQQQPDNATRTSKWAATQHKKEASNASTNSAAASRFGQLDQLQQDAADAEPKSHHPRPLAPQRVKRRPAKLGWTLDGRTAENGRAVVRTLRRQWEPHLDANVVRDPSPAPPFPDRPEPADALPAVHPHE